MKNMHTQSTPNAVEKLNIPLSPIVKSNSTLDLKKVFTNELRDIYLTEKTLIKSLNKLVDKANSELLADALYDHIKETEDHVKRLDKLFSILGINIDDVKKNEINLDLLKSKESLIDKTKNGILRDTVIISACSKIKTYEIACFGSLVAFAKTLGENEISILLNDILNEKKYADESLTEVKEYILNSEPAYEYVDKWQHE